MTNEIEKTIKELVEAKKNVLTLLNNSNSSIDMHGLEYWAGVVENLREKVKSLI